MTQAELEALAAHALSFLDGVAHRLVHDATWGTTTGHVTAPGGLGFPRPQKLVLVGGGAASVAELAQPIEDGFVVTSIAPQGRAVGVRSIKDGELGEPVRDFTVKADAFDVLAATEALSARLWLVPGIRGADRVRVGGSGPTGPRYCVLRIAIVFTANSTAKRIVQRSRLRSISE